MTTRRNPRQSGLEPDFYRSGIGSEIVTECVTPDLCEGGAGAGDDLCVEGNEGPYCEVCEAGRYKDSASGTCEKCSSANAAIATAGLVIGMVFILGLVFAFLYREKIFEFLERKLQAYSEANDAASPGSSTGTPSAAARMANASSLVSSLSRSGSTLSKTNTLGTPE